MRRPALSLALSVLSVLCLIIPNSTTAKQSNPAPGQLILQDGTPVRLRFNHNVSSADATVGQSVDLEVLEEVVVNSVTVVPKSGTALATVTEAEPKRTMGRAGKLEIVLDFVRLADNEKAPIRAVKEGKGGSHTAGMTVGIVATSLVFWPAAPLLLFIHGKDITIPKGAEVIGYVNGDMKLNAANFVHAAEPTPTTLPATSTAGTSAVTNNSLTATRASPPTQQPQPSLVLTAVTVNSTPQGADIFVDDDFAGDTPSTLNIAEGKHNVRVSKHGFQEWVRSVNLHGGSISLNAELATSTEDTHAATTTVATVALVPVPERVTAAPNTNNEPVVAAASTSTSPSSIGWIGVQAQNKGEVALVTNVISGGPGAKAGIQPGDAILALDGRLIKGRDFGTAVAALKPGTQISVNYVHGSSAHEVQLTVGSQY